ncbi:hypothetical protein [Altererythrobacter aquiaggeris]|uniref:hypothetical protein n=1 Tax=Aestuarierythrobacter aquiaggeris TaxID=1898396 RepID=UPI00301627E1
MIRASVKRSGQSFAAGLETKAKAIALATAEIRLRKQNGLASYWRIPRLLWPLFTKG